MTDTSSPIRVGIVGYGHLGQFLVDYIQKDGLAAGLSLAFVWNRNLEKLNDLVPKDLILTNLSEFTQKKADLIVEVCHPQIVKDFGVEFLSHANFLVGSPSALCSSQLDQELRNAAKKHGNTLYVPSGALWGGQDIQRLNDNGCLKALSIRMSKHPSCFRLAPGLLSDWSEDEGRRVLFHGSVADLCPIAPNNVNTMAAAAIAASTLGFQGVTGEIVSDTSLGEYHLVEIEVTGHNGFSVQTVRRNPAKLGAVTGSATYKSFWSSLLVCRGHGGRVYLC
ncbi:aspartate dehydrogenase domain-containing protein [Hoplias malabaricus]|uniref:aspartate dehydrogenase domain-containing protein n=1 Tax=Hoplias malabaricus TaxID=27720 RepID=UPI003462104E